MARRELVETDSRQAHSIEDANDASGSIGMEADRLRASQSTKDTLSSIESDNDQAHEQGKYSESFQQTEFNQQLLKYCFEFQQH